MKISLARILTKDGGSIGGYAGGGSSFGGYPEARRAGAQPDGVYVSTAAHRHHPRQWRRREDVGGDVLGVPTGETARDHHSHVGVAEDAVAFRGRVAVQDIAPESAFG